MNTIPTNLVAIVAYYHELLTRFALRLSRGNLVLAEACVQQALEEAWEEDKFYEGRALRLLLKQKIVANILANEQQLNSN